MKLNVEKLIKKYGNLTSLKRKKNLSLENRRIKDVEPNSFKELDRLENLSLYSNEIVRLEANTFENLTFLETLRLNSNQIESLNQALFRNNTNLVLLDLSGNHLKNLDVCVFDGLFKLEKLLLDNNRLNTIDVRTFIDLDRKNIKLITLFKNPGRFISYSSEKTRPIGPLASERSCTSDIFAFLLQFPLIEEQTLKDNNQLPFDEHETVSEMLRTKRISILEFENTLKKQFSTLPTSKIFAGKSSLNDEDDSDSCIMIEDDAKSTDEANESSGNKSTITVTKNDKKALYRDPFVGLRLHDRYEIQKRILSHPTGQYYLAYDYNQQSTITLFAVSLSLFGGLDDQNIEYLKRLVAIESEHIVKYSDYFEQNSHLFIAFEYFPNGSLKQLISARGNEPFEQCATLEWMVQMLKSLNYLNYIKFATNLPVEASSFYMTDSSMSQIKLGGLENGLLSNRLENRRLTTSKTDKSDDSMTQICSLGYVFYEIIHLKKLSRLEEIEFQSSIFSSTLKKY